MGENPVVKRLKGEALRRLQAEVLDRDDHACQSCWRHSEAPPHHIIFKSEGGRDEADNMITLCETCHYKIHHIQAAKVLATINGQVGNKKLLQYIFKGIIAGHSLY